MKYLLVIVATLMVCNAQALERPIALPPSAVGLGKAPEKPGTAATASVASPASPAISVSPSLVAAPAPASPAISASPSALVAAKSSTPVPASPAIPSSKAFASQMKPVLLNEKGSKGDAWNGLLSAYPLLRMTAEFFQTDGGKLRSLHASGELSKLENGDQDLTCIAGIKTQPGKLKSDSQSFLDRLKKIELTLEACKDRIIDPEHFKSIVTELDNAILPALTLREQLHNHITQQAALHQQRAHTNGHSSHDSGGDQKRQ